MKRGPIPTKVRAVVRARSGGRCEFVWHTDDVDAPILGGLRCRRTATEMHHRLARSRGGENTVENIAHLCLDHHAWTHANPAEARHRGLLLSPPAYDPLAKFGDDAA